MVSSLILKSKKDLYFDLQKDDNGQWVMNLLESPIYKNGKMIKNKNYIAVFLVDYLSMPECQINIYNVVGDSENIFEQSWDLIELVAYNKFIDCDRKWWDNSEWFDIIEDRQSKYGAIF